MCGRFTLTSTPEALAERFGLAVPFLFEPRYNIAPGQDVVAVRAEEGGRRGAWLRWGLVPHWAKDPAIGHRMINARCESVASKPAFRDALRHRRCLVPADGFYEWAPVDHGKQPYHVHLPDRGLFAMAGLWERWRDAAGNALESCSVLTRDATGPIAALHDRMPVILAPELFDAWLDPGREDPADLLPLVASAAGAPPPPRLDLHPVSTRVNRPACDEPACLDPVPAQPRQQGLFS